MEPYIPSEINGFADIPYSSLTAKIRKGLNLPYMILLPRDINMPISTLFFNELAGYARFRKDKMSLLGTVFNSHFVAVEIWMRVIDLCYVKQRQALKNKMKKKNQPLKEIDEL